MVTVLMLLFLVGAAVLVIGGSVKAARMQSSAARGLDVAEYRECLTDADREYIEDSWKNVEGIYQHDPAVALDVAHNTVASVLEARGIDTTRIPAIHETTASASEGRPDSQQEIRRQLLGYAHIVNVLTDATPHP
ncbi:hypothetical protein ABH935_006757 [Catenulispora sp. GAS73]|uniref:hypothetical protein n=1 Tax=Catenulispora sp. GAS73 TaxID=3156269 RepID=UPI00351650DA